MSSELNQEEIIRLFSENSLKGESYYIRFRYDDTLYLGIPVIRSSFGENVEGTFSFQVLKPEEKAGIYNKNVSDITLLEKR